MLTIKNVFDGGGILNLGEIKAYNLLAKDGWIVEDVTKDSYYYDKDIDFLIQKNQQQFSIEVKWDSRIGDTGNMFIETYTDLDNCIKGWFSFCKADYLFYGDSQNQIFYVFSVSDLRQFIDSNSMEHRKAPDYTKRGTLKKVSQGMIVPISEFSQTYSVNVVSVCDF